MQNFKHFQNNPYAMDCTSTQDTHYVQHNIANRYVYVKQHVSNVVESPKRKVLINPHFGKKVFINPNFQVKTSSHVPKAPQKIHVNPNILKMHNVKASHTNKTGTMDFQPIQNKTDDKATYQSPTLIRDSDKEQIIENSPGSIKKRRLSIRSQYRIVKSSVLDKSIKTETSKKRGTLFKSKYKLVKVKSPSQISKSQGINKMKKSKSMFKLDRRKLKQSPESHQRSRRFIYINKFTSTSELAKVIPPKPTKNLSLVNIRGVLYKKSHTSLRRTSISKRSKKIVEKVQRKSILKSKYKIIRSHVLKSPINKITKNKRSSLKTRLGKTKVNPAAKMRKCNIPCPYYRKYGKCKGKENGKCYRKHDPDQIALCTKFLQGACIDEKCLLSHNVSPEKMPTCKFYLEGMCSKDNCPYLHVRLSPKADICRDFLEGFCKMATKCNRRHQLLCPDFEKNGTCQKQRCPYPHGRMVRKYSVFNKHKFAKKSSNNEKHKDVTITENVSSSSKFDILVPSESNTKARYYTEQKCLVQPESISEVQTNETSAVCDNDIDFWSRPKLGELPSFIAFEET